MAVKHHSAGTAGPRDTSGRGGLYRKNVGGDILFRGPTRLVPILFCLSGQDSCSVLVPNPKNFKDISNIFY